ncbi:MAG: ABC transporter permease [Pyrinomonadaceae bacterium]|nr:ABC transporter permease [Pyrinomonadaceae bacterium]
MPYEIFLALRYLRSRRSTRRSWSAHITALVAVLSIALGVAGLITALALANGFRDEMQDKILRGTAHITLARADNQRITNHSALISELRSVTGVIDASATTYAGALLSTDQAAIYTILRGINCSAQRAVAEVQRALIAGSIEPLLHEASLVGSKSDKPLRHDASNDLSGELEDLPLAEAIIGVELAARANLRVGDKAEIIISEVAGPLDDRALRRRPIRVAGIFRFGLYEYDSTWIYLSLDRLESGPEAPASVISIKVADIYNTPAVRERVRAAVGSGWTVVDWQQANQALFAALALERRVVWLVIVLIMVIAGLNITTTLVLVVVERRAEIAILATMGARPLNIISIFMLEGAFVGLIGTLAGITFGLSLCFIGDHFALIQLPADVYSISQVPFHPRARDVLLTAAIAFIVSLLATVYPARAAARARPAEALRYEG